MSRFLLHLRTAIQRLASSKSHWPKEVSVETPDGCIQFCVSSEIEQWRTESLLTKEIGTVAWIRRSLRPGDTFLDIGANIGIYSLLAALRVGDEGRVYSVEPHLLNCVSLLRNISKNSFGNRIRPMCLALHKMTQSLPFNYRSLIPGTSMSQLDNVCDSENNVFQPVAIEWKISAALDDLLDQGWMKAPDLIKIDVDGNEPLILEGMLKLLSGQNAPREIQVEINDDCATRINNLLASCGFESIERHDTSAGLARLAAGDAPDQVAHNMIFRRIAAHSATELGAK